MISLYDLLVFLGCDPKPTISNEELMRLTDAALDEHIKHCSKCEESHDPNYGDLVAPCDEYYNVVSRIHTRGRWTWCNQGWVLAKEHPELR